MKKLLPMHQQLNFIKKVTSLFVVQAFFAFQFINAQPNLILNGSFENFTGTCPTGAPNGAFTQVLNWTVPNPMPVHGIPHAELYCGGPNYGGCMPGPVPNVGSNGIAYVGFHTRVISQPYNESVYQILSTPLIAGSSYTISFDLMNCQSGLFTSGSSDFCVYSEADTAIRPACPSSDPSVVLLGCVPFDSISNTVWKHHSFSFIAPPGANMLGFSGAGCFTTEIYYYLDNVVLVADSAAPVLFASSDTAICKNNCIDFFDLSNTNPTSWQWFFPGADSATSSLQNPTNICYNTAGSFDVTLIACNGSVCDTLVLTNFITAAPLPSPVITQSLDTLFSSPAVSYQWYSVSSGSMAGETNYYFIPTLPGDYFVTVTDSTGCSGVSDTVSIIAFIPSVNLSSSDTTFCEKQCIDFYDLSTNNPTSWQWFFPGSDSLTSSLQNPTNICYNSYGSFDVTLIACNAAGCDTLVLTDFITEYQTPVPTISQSNDTLFSSPGVAYQWWSVDSGIIIGATDYYYIPPYGGSYYVLVTDTNGCEGVSNTIVLTGIEEAKGKGQMAIVPNPNQGSFIITLNESIGKDFSVRIINAMGQTIYQKQEANGNPDSYRGQEAIDVNMDNAAPGLYIVEVTNDGKVYRSRFIVQ